MYNFFSLKFLKEFDGIKDVIAYMKNIVLFPISRRERINVFNSFIDKHIIPYVSSVNDCYDLVIHGSDQIWRKQPEIHNYNPVYFGNHQIKCKCNISYAASMGVLPSTDTEKLLLKNLLCHLDKISVREEDLMNLVVELGYKCRQDLDPTLLMTGNDWCDLLHITSNVEEKYVLFYNLLPNSFELKKISDFAISKGLKLKIIHSTASRPKSETNITTADPQRFLELVYNADFVFTSSFHGLVFSLLFHKPFYASFSKKPGRAASLLSMLNLSEKLLVPYSEIPKEYSKIDYGYVEKQLLNNRLHSLNYLRRL
jgi:hypothetical protein